MNIYDKTNKSNEKIIDKELKEIQKENISTEKNIYENKLRSSGSLLSDEDINKKLQINSNSSIENKSYETNAYDFYKYPKYADRNIIGNEKDVEDNSKKDKYGVDLDSKEYLNLASIASNTDYTGFVPVAFFDSEREDNYEETFNVPVGNREEE